MDDQSAGLGADTLAVIRKKSHLSGRRRARDTPLIASRGLRRARVAAQGVCGTKST